MLLLVNYRPEYQHAWGSRTYYTQLRLDPLPPESAEELLGALLGPDIGLHAVKRLLIAQTEGNPFFLEESVRALVEDGVLVGDPGAYRLAPQVGAAPRGRPVVGNHRGLPVPIDIQIPATVQAVLAARIDRLAPGDKALLQTASVVGKDVPFALLQAIAEVGEVALHAAIGRLQDAEFRYEAGLFPDLEYTFKHALTHEVTYGSLFQDRRRTLHRQIVETIERLYPHRLTEHLERLDHHALRGNLWEKAVTYLRQAGAKALARSANREALASFEQGLTALTPYSLMFACLGLAYLNSVRGDLSQAAHLLERAVAQCREWNITLFAPIAAASLGQVYARSGRLDEGLSWLQQALTAYESTGIGLFHSISVVQLGETYLLADQVEEARTCADRAVRLACERGERGYEAWALRLLGDIAAHESRPDVATAEAHYGAAIALAEELGMRPLAAHCHLGLGTLYTKIGRLERARAELSTASKLYGAMDMAFWLPQAEAALARLEGR